MREVGKNLEIPLHVFGPETHMTAIVGMALQKREVPSTIEPAASSTANFLLPGSVGFIVSVKNPNLFHTAPGHREFCLIFYISPIFAAILR